MKHEEFVFAVPGIEDEMFSLSDDLARIDELLMRSYRETDRRMRANAIELFQRAERGHARSYQKPVSLGRISVNALIAKFGVKR